MKNKTLAAIVGVVSCSVALAAPLTTIDNEQTGAAAYVTATYITNYTELTEITMVDAAQYLAEATFVQLRAVTTPAALRTMANGIVLTCRNGGTATVRMTRGVPRVLNIEWNACRPWYDPTLIPTGPGQIVLVNDSFTPTHVAAITLGSPTRDVLLPHSSNSPDETQVGVLRRNVRMVGLIPVTSDFSGDGTHKFAYAVDGTRADSTDYTFPGTGRAPEHYEVRTEIRGGLVSGTIAWQDDAFYYDDDHRYLAGNFSSTTVSSYFGTQTIRWSVDNLRLSRVTDYANWTGNYSWDGGYTWAWNAAASPGCANGRFVLRTKSLFTIPSLDDPGAADSGELSINNGAATFRQYTPNTVPPGLPPTTRTLLSMQLRNGATYNYDLALFPVPVHVAAGCQ